MAGVAVIALSEKELGRVLDWYLAHMLAEENSAADDTLAEKLRGYSGAVACDVA